MFKAVLKRLSSSSDCFVSFIGFNYLINCIYVLNKILRFEYHLHMIFLYYILHALGLALIRLAASIELNL